MGEFLDPLNPNVTAFLDTAAAAHYQETGDAAASQQMALQALSNLRDQQASSLAYFDVFWVAAVLAACCSCPPCLLMKRSVAEKGEQVGGE